MKKGILDKTVIDHLNEQERLPFQLEVSGDEKSEKFCFLIDHPSLLPAAIRLGALSAHLLGILLFLFATLSRRGKWRGFFVKFYQYSLWTPFMGLLAMLYWKVTICWQNYVYWILMAVDLILNYGWLTFGNEVAKSFMAWVEDPETVDRIDNEKKGGNKKVVPVPSSYQATPQSTPSQQRSESGSDIENFVQKNQMRAPPGQQRPGPRQSVSGRASVSRSPSIQQRQAPPRGPQLPPRR